MGNFLKNDDVQKVEFSWEDVCIDAKVKTVRTKTVVTKPILKNLSGRISPGNFMAIIGRSGSGKTTLMNYLSGRLFSSNLEVTGTVKINGK